MSEEYKGKSNLDIAQEAERDLNSYEAKTGSTRGASDSVLESGVDESVRDKFPGADVAYGSAASGANDNREIPVSEGGGNDPRTGKPYKARDFEGVGGPEDKERIFAEAHGGDDNVRGNIRQGGETVRPPGQTSNDSAQMPDNVR